MRRILFLGLTLAMSAFLFTNCAFQDWEPQPSENNGDVGGNTPGEKTDVPFEIAASIVQTKTANNDGELVWAAGDRLNAFHTVSSTTAIVNDGEVTLADAGKGLFEGTLAKGLKDGYAYDWYLFYPYTENLTIYENAAEITIGAAAGSAQRQVGNDSKAHLAGTAMPLFGAATGVEAGKTPAAQMHHLASIVEVVVTNGVTPPLKVSEVAVTANEAIVGTFGLDLSTSTLTYNPASTSNTAKLAVDGAAELAHGESAKFYIVVKPFSATPGTGIKLSVNGYEKEIILADAINCNAGETASVAFEYDRLDFEESLAGAYQIKGLWVYGGTGPEYGGAGFVDMHNKSWLFDEEAGHGIAAEMDNYLEFTLVDVLDGGNKTTGTCVNWAGADGKNWSCWYKQSEVPWNQADLTHFYRQIPVGESTWVRDYTVEPNTVTFTDSEGKTTVLELLAPQNANGHEFTNETFHTKLSGTDNWNKIYNDIDKVYYKPRNYYIEVAKVDAVPEASRTTEPVFVPTLPPDPSEVPPTIAGTYKYSNALCFGGIDPAFVGLVEKSWAFSGSIWCLQDDLYIFTATGQDENGNEIGEVDYQGGSDGYWDYIMPASYHKKDGIGDLDLSPFYGKIAQGKSQYIYDKTNCTVTFISDKGTDTARLLVPGSHDFSGKAHEVIATFALDFDLNYTGPNVPGYAQDWSDFERFYVAPHNYVLHLQKQ